MFGIDLAAPEFPGLLCGILQQLVALFAQPVGDGASAAAPRSTPRRALAESGVDDSVIAITHRAERAASQRTVTKEAAKTALAEEFVKKGTPSEQGLQRRGAAPRPARHFAVMLIAQLHVLNFAVHRGAHARRRRATANIASSVCHSSSPFSLSSQGWSPIICASDNVTQRPLPFFSPWTQLPQDRARPRSLVAGDPAPIAR